MLEIWFRRTDGLNPQMIWISLPLVISVHTALIRMILDHWGRDENSRQNINSPPSVCGKTSEIRGGTGVVCVFLTQRSHLPTVSSTNTRHSRISSKYLLSSFWELTANLLKEPAKDYWQHKWESFRVGAAGISQGRMLGWERWEHTLP